MTRIKTALFFLLISVLLLSSCQSINRNSINTELSQFTIIFSFDDGPNARDDTTARLLDVLKKYEIRSYFALLGENAEAHPELVRRIYNEGHIIVNHGYSDMLVHRMGDEEFYKNLVEGEIAISAALGKELNQRLYRPHGGFYKSSQEQIWQEAAYTMVPANIRIYDALLNTANYNKAFRRIIKKAEKQGSGIIMLHDGRDSHFRMEREIAKNPQGTYNRSWIPGFVEEIIITLISKGFVLKIPEY